MTIHFASLNEYLAGITLALLISFLACLLLLNSAMRRRYNIRTAFNCRLFNFLLETDKKPAVGQHILDKRDT